VKESSKTENFLPSINIYRKVDIRKVGDFAEIVTYNLKNTANIEDDDDLVTSPEDKNVEMKSYRNQTFSPK